MSKLAAATFVAATSFLATPSLAASTCLQLPGGDAKYPRCKELKKDKLYMHWKADSAANTIEVKLVAQDHPGWFAVAATHSGGMKGADFIVVRPDAAASAGAVVEDRYASDYAAPELDADQHVTLVSYSSAAGTQTAVFSRAMDTCDTLDLPFRKDGVSSMMWAMGSTPTFSYHSERAGFSVDFLEEVAAYTPPTDLLRVEIKMPTIDIVTTAGNGVEDPRNPYDCVVVDLQDQMGDKWKDTYHIVRTGPILDAQSADLVHHILAFACTAHPGYTGVHAGRGSCLAMNTRCLDMKVAWAVGGGDVVMPDIAGLPLGGQRYIFMQMHYYNPNLRPSKDSSGVFFDLTRQMRQEHAGFLWTGQLIEHIALPAYFKGLLEPTGCQAGCWEKTWRKNVSEVNIIAAFHHLHTVGNKMRIDVVRDGVHMGPILDQRTYDFQHQNFHSPNIKKLTRADSLVTQCSYDASKRPRDSLFADGTSDEMCIGILLHYPVQSTFWCAEKGYGPVMGLPEQTPSAAQWDQCVSDCKADDYPVASVATMCNECQDNTAITNDACSVVENIGLCPGSCLNCNGTFCSPNCTAPIMDAHSQRTDYKDAVSSQCKARCLKSFGGRVKNDGSSVCHPSLGSTPKPIAYASGPKLDSVWPLPSEPFSKCSVASKAAVVAAAPKPKTCAQHSECGQGEYCANGVVGLQDYFSGTSVPHFCSPCRSCCEKVNALGPNGETDRLYSCPCGCACPASPPMCSKGVSTSAPWKLTAFCPSLETCVAPSGCTDNSVCPSNGLEAAGHCGPCSDWNSFLFRMSEQGVRLGGLAVPDCTAAKLFCEVTDQLPAGIQPKKICPVTCGACSPPDTQLQVRVTGCPGQQTTTPTPPPTNNTQAPPPSSAVHQQLSAVVVVVATIIALTA